jgi:hypothetical protein
VLGGRRLPNSNTLITVATDVKTTASRLAVVTPVKSRRVTATTAPAICSIPSQNLTCFQRVAASPCCAFIASIQIRQTEHGLAKMFSASGNSRVNDAQPRVAVDPSRVP